MGSPSHGRGSEGSGEEEAGSWRLRMGSEFHVPDRFHRQPPFYARIFGGSHGKQRKIAQYYKKQENLLKDFSEMETMNELGALDLNAPTEEELRQLAKSERFAINLSNIINLILFVTKVVASVESLSMAVIASTLDSLLNLLSGFILWFTAHATKKRNRYSYSTGKRRMRPVGIIVFGSVMGILGFLVLIESGRRLITQEHTNFDRKQEQWMVGSVGYDPNS